ncbi:SH3 domain-binding protein 5-like isoform X4 [Nerophis ophidion]|uniref:SH3 domain-binding protein 5-like isoform X4 n=1 Tax=Nerophis ophidion TaxID=159077 RepID=UPI002AE06B8D|nr:SH3 domain-binding protein 5-like isoform X4 [Nerophis ophidion]
MEPGTSRETRTDAGCHKRADMRENTPGEEAKGGNGGTVMLRRRGRDEAVKLKDEKCEYGGEVEDQVKRDGEDFGKYEEELDPRIQAQQETQKAALRYERAVSMHTAAREMVYVAEQGLLADRNTMDPTWQEMLNHATAKVNEAEEERFRSEREHQRVTQLCQEAEARVQTLQKSLKKVILKSKPYFELKAQFNHILEEHKAKVVQLEEHVSKVKTRYSVALRNLEQISEQIHAQRGRIQVSRGRPSVCGGRSSPVGAEADIRVAVGVPLHSVVGASGIESNWVDNEKTRLWVEKHRESGWGHREQLEGEHGGSDRLSIISLQTIVSDLEKCDSVDHLGDLSDVGSVIGEVWDWSKKNTSKPGNVVEVADRLQQVTTHQQIAADGEKKQESFIKQHHRSVSV